MLSSYRVHGLLRTFANSKLIKYVNVKGLHSFEHKKYIRPFKRKMGKPIKSKTNDQKKDPKVYMRNTIGMISNILRYSTWDSAQEQLDKLSIKWDSYTINQVLKTHPPMEKAWLFFNWALRLRGFKHDQYTYTTMLDIFGEAGRISSMKLVFQQMQEKGIIVDAVTYTALLHWLSKSGDLEGSLEMWEEMKVKECSPTVVTYTAVMKVLFDNNRAKDATEVYKEMLESGCSPNCYTYTVLMEYLISTGRFKEALEIMSKMQEAGVQPDKATCNILVQKFSRAGEIWAVNHILKYMKEHKLVLRHPVYVQALQALKVAGESNELLKEANRHLSLEGTDVEEVTADFHSTVDTAIIKNLLAKRNFIAVEHIIDGMISMNIQVSSKLISAIIQSSCVNNRPTCAVSACNYGIKMGICIERQACLSLIGFMIRSNLFSELVEIVENMVGSGVSLGTYLLSLVIYKLGSTQMPASCLRIFCSLPDDQKNTVTYTALMGAYFCSREVDKGLDIFHTMRRNGVPASPSTYRLLIVGLKEAGRVYEAEKYIKEERSVQRGCFPQEAVSMEEHLCELLFSGGVALC
ncbi:hypothetical protein IFM89_039449 [Coptis chinensis]|uniref:Pentatricopeptide repeat-containing protein n=1 Tax=Coptis chinensis TaxID=261450 RepID=A0A835M6F1_9MAGN|nr:hypothetical protein IFM89_039449 [Coptis chinensis]